MKMNIIIIIFFFQSYAKKTFLIAKSVQRVSEIFLLHTKIILFFIWYKKIPDCSKISG